LRSVCCCSSGCLLITHVTTLCHSRLKTEVELREVTFSLRIFRYLQILLLSPAPTTNDDGYPLLPSIDSTGHIIDKTQTQGEEMDDGFMLVVDSNMPTPATARGMVGARYQARVR
jgi:hypothetical protein